MSKEITHWRTRITIEDTKRIDVRLLKRSGLLIPGVSGELSWLVKGEPVGTIGFLCHDSSVELNYRYKAPDNQWQAIKQFIGITNRIVDSGFDQLHFICPGCSHQVYTLSGHGKLFLCRHCYQHPYGSMRAEPHTFKSKISSQLITSPVWSAKSHDSLFDEYCEFSITLDKASSLQLKASG